MLRKILTIVLLVGLAVGLGLFLNMATSSIVTLSAFSLLVMVSKEFHEWKNKRDEIRKAKESGMICGGCGYNMEGQEIPRCPECGALRGFTTSVDELGLTEDEIRRGFQRKRASGDSPNRQK